MNTDIPLHIPEPFNLKAIFAVDEARVIGYKGGLPWHLPEDLKYFSKETRGHTVLMGRKTYESLPDRYRPLPDRINIVLSRNAPPERIPETVFFFTSVEDFFTALSRGKVLLPTNQVWLLGGANVYRQLIPFCKEVHITRVPGRHEGDTFLERFEDSMKLSREIPGETCKWQIYTRE
jgi:dihydrofolate reductase